MKTFVSSGVLLTMKSDTDPEWEADSRVLFQKNQKNEINRTEPIGGNDTCFFWFAYIRVSNFLFEYLCFQMFLRTVLWCDLEKGRKDQIFACVNSGLILLDIKSLCYISLWFSGRGDRRRCLS